MVDGHRRGRWWLDTVGRSGESPWMDTSGLAMVQAGLKEQQLWLRGTMCTVAMGIMPLSWKFGFGTLSLWLCRDMRSQE